MSESIGVIMVKVWEEGFKGRKMGNKELWVSPVLTIVGCLHLTAQKTAPLTFSFMSHRRSNYFLDRN